MNSSWQKDVLFLLFIAAQPIAIQLMRGISSDAWLRSPTGNCLFFSVDLVVGSFLVPHSWRYGRRLIRFASLQCFVFALLIEASGWNAKDTLQDVISEVVFYVFALLPIPIVWIFRD